MINLHALQLEAGVDFCLMENPTTSIGYLTPTWLTSVRDFMANHNITMTISDQPNLIVRSPTDQFIMQPEHLQRYTPAQQKDINLVRLHLQATTLVDLADTNRPEAICLHSLDGNRPSNFKRDSYWPRQPVPSTQQKRLWKRFIASSFLRYIPLWKQTPMTVAAATVFTTGPQVPQPHYTETLDPIKFSLLTGYIKSLPKTQRRMISDVKQTATDLQVWRAFRSRERLAIASDGGLDGQHGTFGWVLATKKMTIFECGGPVDGPYDTISSTRSELAGFASALLFITAIYRHWGIRHQCTFKWITDSKASLSRVIKMVRKRSVIGRLPHNSDLLTLIRSLMMENRRMIVLSWVKGHQDRLKAYESLSLEAQLNMTANFLATRYRLRGKLRATQYTDHPYHQRISLSLNGVQLTSQIDECFRFHINGYHLRRYLQSKRKWTDRIWDSINFDLFGRHYQQLGAALQVFQTKLSYDQLPLGRINLYRSKVADKQVALCPCCTRATEDTFHFLAATTIQLSTMV
jgi:hypothetical protein